MEEGVISNDPLNASILDILYNDIARNEDFSYIIYFFYLLISVHAARADESSNVYQQDFDTLRHLLP